MDGGFKCVSGSKDKTIGRGEDDWILLNALCLMLCVECFALNALR